MAYKRVIEKSPTENNTAPALMRNMIIQILKLV